MSIFKFKEFTLNKEEIVLSPLRWLSGAMRSKKNIHPLLVN